MIKAQNRDLKLCQKWSWHSRTLTDHGDYLPQVLLFTVIFAKVYETDWKGGTEITTSAPSGYFTAIAAMA